MVMESKDMVAMEYFIRENISPDIENVLRRLEIKGNTVKITEQLDRKLYENVNKVLESLGGKWNRSAKAHIFPSDPTERINAVLTAGKLEPKIKTGYFPTPPGLARRMVEMLELKPGDKVLEPSAGQGGLLDQLPKGTQVIIGEILPENIQILKQKGYIVNFDNFLGVEIGGITKVIMNPPFENQQDIEHVTHALRMLQPGGTLVSVMSPGIKFRDNKKTTEFIEMLDRDYYHEIIDLPEGSFKESGTGVNAVLLKVTKPMSTPSTVSSEFVADTTKVNPELAARSHMGTSWDPEKRAQQEIAGFAGYVQEVYDNLKPYAKTEAQRAFLDTEIKRFQDGFAKHYNALLARKGQTMSTFITGGSGFNVRRAEKANAAESSKYTEMIEFRDRAKAAILRELKKMAVEEAGGELEVLKKKVADATRNHEFMVKTNAIVRKKIPDDQKIKEIQALAPISETTVRKILTPDYMGRIGFPAYALSNDTANIHRMEERVKELEKKEITPTGEIPFTGGYIIDNREADRVQIIFDQRPSQAVIDKLKSEGWRWSPANVAWQRKRTDAAMYSAKRITGAVTPAPAVQPQVAPPIPAPIIPAPQLYALPELRWVYGTQDLKWHLVGHEDRDYAHGISQERMKIIGPDAAKAEYLSPSFAAAPAVSEKSNIDKLIAIMEKYAGEGKSYEDFVAGLKGVYLSRSGYEKHGMLDIERLRIDRENAGYKSLTELWNDTSRKLRMRMYVPPKFPPMLYPAPEVKKYTTPRFFKKGTIARNIITNEKFVLQTDVEALQQDKNAEIWKTNDAHGYLIYLEDQRPAATPITREPAKISSEDMQLLKSYEKITDYDINKRITLNQGKLKVLAARKLVRIEKGQYGTMGSAYIEQERLGISQEISRLYRIQELRELIAAQARPEPWKLTQEEYWRAGAGGKAFEGRRTSDYNHKQAVYKAFSEGKPVSPNVLKDYPDIVTPLRKENEEVLAKIRAEREQIRAAERADENELNAELNKLPPALKRFAETEITGTLHLPETHKDYRNRFYIALGKVRSIAFAHQPKAEKQEGPVEPLSDYDRVLKAYLENRGYELTLQDFIWADKYTLRGTARHIVGSQAEKKRRQEYVSKNYNEDVGKKLHRGTVVSALERGIKVPDIVLKDYPDLVKKEVPVITAPKVQTIQDVKQQVIQSIHEAKDMGELKQILKGFGFLPLPEPDKRQLLDLYQVRYSQLTGELTFGQRITEEEIKKRKAPRKVTYVPGTSRRLEEFGIKEGIWRYGYA